MFAGIPVKGENGSGLRVQFPVCCLCPDIRCVIGWGRGQVKGDNACATPDIADTSPIRFSSLFRGLRATKRPTTPVAICCIPLLLSARVPSPLIRPQFLSLRPRNLAPLLFFLFFFFCRPCVSNNLRWTAAEIASVSFGSIVIEYALWIFFFFFFLFVSSRFSRFIVVYSFFFWTTWRGHLKKWHRYSLRGTSSITDLLIFFFFFFLALRSCYFRWIYFDLVFKYDFWEILSLFLVRTRKRATRFSTNWIGIHIFDHFFFVTMFIDLSLFNPILVFGIKFFDNIIIFIWLK